MQSATGELVIEEKKFGKRKGFRRVDADDTDELPEIMQPLPPAAALAPRGSVLEGVPNGEDAPTVIEARSCYAAVRADMVAADSLVNSLSSELDLPANTTRGRIEAVMIDLISNGKPIEKIAQLEAAILRARLLRAAAEKAFARIQPAVEVATRAACNVAYETLYAPAERLLAERLLAFVVEVREFRKTVNRIQGAGLHGAIRRSVPNLLTVDTDTLDSHALRCALESGHLTREQIREALPELAGI